jgi:hypothetical protein
VGRRPAPVKDLLRLADMRRVNRFGGWADK